jgi:biopolymer transport protein ExbB
MLSIWHFIRGGGFVMYPLLLLSLVAVGVIVERLLAFRELGGLSPGLLQDVMTRCRAGRDEEALRACEARPGPLAACLAMVLRHHHQPSREVEQLVEETGQSYFLRLEHLLPILDTTTTIAPLLGLLGTIAGMIGTFRAIAAQTGRGGNTDAILSGVGEALYATATGLTIAVICFIAYNTFAARLRTVTGETAQAVTKLMNVLNERQQREPGTNSHRPQSELRIEEKERRGVQATT